MNNLTEKETIEILMIIGNNCREKSNVDRSIQTI
jgi:hypothetical protein